MQLYAQDTLRIGSRLVLNLGVRYEGLGAIRSIGSVQDILLPATPGSSQQLFSPQNRWAGRFGFSYAPGQNAATLLRGGYGIFHDNPFETVWQSVRNNSVSVATFHVR